MRGSLRMLAIGAHPDDIEIGAAALIAKMRDLGHEVHLLVLTDDPVNGRTRRAEATNAAGEMGVPPERVSFAGIQEGYLKPDIESVHLVRQLMNRLDLRPDIVVTHTRADSHNDHVASNGIAHAAFRDSVFLHYSTHVSCEISHFRPTVFVDVTRDRLLVKERAIKSYHSQASRIGRHDLTGYEEKLGRLARLDRAESFEIGVQYGAEDVVRKTIGLSDSPFHRFWLPTVTRGTVTLLYEAHTACDGAEASTHRNAGRDRLRQAFADQWSPYPVRELCSDAADALAAARRGSTVTIGDPRTNRVAGEFQEAGAPVWTVEGSGKGRYLRNRATETRLYSTSPDGGQDLGYVARFGHPYANGAHVVSVAGVTDVATRAGVEFLADPGRVPELARVFEDRAFAQVVYAAEAGELRIVDVQPATDGRRG